jgi:hypothetical protein
MNQSVEQQLQIKLLLESYKPNDKIQMYKDKGATPYIIDILSTQKDLNNPKRFGVLMEHVAEQLLGLDPSINSEHDKMLLGKKIEIKTSSISFKTKIFQFNSIRLNFDYDYLLLQNINYNRLDYWIISKEKIKQLSLTLWKQKQKKKGIIQLITFSKIKEYCIRIDYDNIRSFILKEINK